MKRKSRFSCSITVVLSRFSFKTIGNTLIVIFPLDMTCIKSAKFSTFYSVSEVIIECAYTVIAGSNSGFRRIFGSFITASPRFAVNHNIRVNLVKFFVNFCHHLFTVNTHKVKAESIDMVIKHPVFQRINHIFYKHRRLGVSFVATTRTVRISSIRFYTIIIVRHC